MLSFTKMLIDKNYSKGVIITPKYIVIHETDNTSKGANAIANRNYFANHDEAQASTHFVVDDNTIVQCAEFEIGKAWRCWHVGDNKSYSNITNSNSVGIEICVNSDGDYMKARQNAIELTIFLMKKLNISESNVVKHENSSGKHCPRKMIDNPSLWNDFKKQLIPVVVSTIPTINPVKTPSLFKFIKELQITKDTNCFKDNDLIKVFFKNQFVTAIDEGIENYNGRDREVYYTTIGWILKSDIKDKGYPYNYCISGIVNVFSKLNIREKADGNSKVIGSFKKDDQITIIDLSLDNEWGKTSLGWVSLDYIIIK